VILVFVGKAWITDNDDLQFYKFACKLHNFILYGSVKLLCVDRPHFSKSFILFLFVCLQYWGLNSGCTR
jgi:hypothetical protein